MVFVLGGAYLKRFKRAGSMYRGGLRDMDVGSHEGLPVIKNSRSPGLVHFTATYLAHCTDERVAYNLTTLKNEYRY